MTIDLTFDSVKYNLDISIEYDSWYDKYPDYRGKIFTSDGQEIVACRVKNHALEHLIQDAINELETFNNQ